MFSWNLERNQVTPFLYYYYFFVEKTNTACNEVQRA